MRKLVLLLLANCIAYNLYAQSVGIGTTTPNASAQLEIASANKGMLVPRMSTALREGITTPAKGLLVFDNNTNSFWYHNGGVWTELAAGSGDNLWYKVQDSITNAADKYVGINADYSLIGPQANLQVNGNLLIQGSLRYSNASPTAAQTYTMNNTSNEQLIPISDSIFRIYDPGGISDYNNNMQGNIGINPSTSVLGYKISSSESDFGIGTGDTLWLSYVPYPNCRDDYVYRFLNTTINPEEILLDRDRFAYFIFRSNSDGNNGKGFNFTVTCLYNNSGPLKVINAAGPAMYFNCNEEGAFSAGYNSNARRGCIALGRGADANAVYSTAIGQFATASGILSTSIGPVSKARGNSATAIGYDSKADGDYSTAIGRTTTAGGNYSTALGYISKASGNYSIAIGNYVSTNEFEGSLAIGDHSTTTDMLITTANSFKARFDGGYRFYTSAATINAESCLLAPGSNAWSTSSDWRLKENFAPVNGEHFLEKISAMQLSSWNYKKQNPSTFRHYGPMAQDFYAAFGKDKYGSIGNDTTINSADFAGVNFIAIHALEKRTQKIKELEKENAALKLQQQEINKAMDELRTRLNKMEAGKKKKNK